MIRQKKDRLLLGPRQTCGQLKRWRNPRGAATRVKRESSSCQRNTAPQHPLLKGNQRGRCRVCRWMTDAFTHRRPCAYLCRWARAIGVTLIIRVVLYQCIESCLLYGLQSLSLFGHTPGLKHPRVVHILQCCKVTVCRCLSPYLSEVGGHLYLICIFLYLSCLLLVPSALFFFSFSLLSFFLTAFSKETMIQVPVRSVNTNVFVWSGMNVCQEIGVPRKRPGTGCGGQLGLPGASFLPSEGYG